MDKNQGYAILKAVVLENGRCFALGENPKEPQPFVTWASYNDEHGIRQYEWGHYFSDKADAKADFDKRVREYRRQYKVDIIQTEAPGLYKYYSTQRPVDIGAFPKFPHNAPDEIVNYDQRVPVEGGAFQAWGHLTYTRPLTEKQAADYELRPAPGNPDLRRLMEEQTQAVGQWEDARHVPDQKRLTWFYPDFGCYVLKEFVTPEELVAAAKSIEAAKTRTKPVPIAEQMKEGQKLSQEHRGQASPSKDMTDKGGDR